MNITSIRQQVKNPERVSIFIDGKYNFSLSLDQLVSEKIKNNEEIDEVRLKKLKKISEDGKLRARSLEWLLNRPHSTREFKDYLYRKKAEPELIEKFISEFTKKGYLDDAKFAQWFVELQGRRNKSNRQVKAELFKKGIGRDIADVVMEEQGDDEQARIKGLIAKKVKSSRYKNDPLRLAKYLTSQGFSYSDVKKALNLNNEYTQN